MNMRFRDVSDSHTLFGGRPDVGVDVAVRVDNERLTGLHCRNQVTGLRKLVVVEAPHEHHVR
jgi:hypothetical protein